MNGPLYSQLQDVLRVNGSVWWRVKAKSHWPHVENFNIEAYTQVFICIAGGDNRSE